MYRAAARRLPHLRRSAASRPHLLVETVLIVLLLTVYDKIKDIGSARRGAAVDHGFALLHLERRLHIAVEAGTNSWLAGHPLLGQVSSHFYEFAWCFLAIGALIACWVRRPDLYRPARNAMLLINGIGLAIFFAYPTAPPRLLPGTAFRDVVADAGYGVAHDGRLPADEYAAMPSLHLGWSIFAAVLICRLVRNRIARAVAIAYPVLTAVVVITSANHYVLDVVAGSALAIFGCAVSGLLPLRRRNVAAAPDAAAPVADAPEVPGPRGPLPADGRRVLVISASIGAGHDGAAAELRRRLEAQGYAVEVRDFLDALVGPVGWLFKRIYGGMLRAAPQSYDWLYWSIERRPWLEHFASWFAGWSSFTLRRWLRGGADVVVSTYPLASQALGRLRDRGELRVPLITFLTDMSVSKMWVHPGVDLHLACSEETASQARAAGAGAVLVTGPMVPDRFFAEPGPDVRERVRSELGVAAGDSLALLVAGSWGVGDVEATARELLGTGAAVPVVVCGRNADLQHRLQRVPGVVAIGWTDTMHELMCAADVLVQNAGGLSCMEAFARGLPAISYRCIPGHGEHNAGVMDRIGIAPWARKPDDLTALLVALQDPLTRQRQAARAAETFRSDPADSVLAQAVGSDGVAFSPHRQRRARRVAASVATAGVLAWAGTGGVAAAASHGVGVVHPAAHQSGSVYLVVRTPAGATFSADTLGDLSRLRAAVVVERTGLRENSSVCDQLSAHGINFVVHGSKSVRTLRLPAEPAAGVLTGVRPFVLANNRRPDAMDVGLAYLHEDNLVTPTTVLHAVPASLPGGVVLLDLRGQSQQALDADLGELVTALNVSGLSSHSLDDLQGIRT